MLRGAARAAFALVSIAGAAHAGRSAFGWLNDTETLPERSVDLEQWISDERSQGPANVYEATVWWAPVIGLTDQLELALPVQLVWERTGMDSSTEIHDYGAELHWRLVTSDPVDAPAWVPMLRAAVRREVTEVEAVQFELGGVLSYTHGRFHAVADAAIYEEVRPGEDRLSTCGGVGASVALTHELRLGAEAWLELALRGEAPSDDWAAVGPALSWTHGRFWVTASYDVGVYQIASAPRLKWAVAF